MQSNIDEVVKKAEAKIKASMVDKKQILDLFDEQNHLNSLL